MGGPAGGSKRGRKRARRDTSTASEDEAISGSRLNALMSLVARVFARQQAQQMPRPELLEAVNAGVVDGEDVFDDEEFNAGLRVMEARNKLLVAEESGEVMLVG